MCSTDVKVGAVSRRASHRLINLAVELFLVFFAKEATLEEND